MGEGRRPGIPERFNAARIALLALFGVAAFALARGGAALVLETHGLSANDASETTPDTFEIAPGR